MSETVFVVIRYWDENQLFGPFTDHRSALLYLEKFRPTLDKYPGIEWELLTAGAPSDIESDIRAFCKQNEVPFLKKAFTQ